MKNKSKYIISPKGTNSDKKTEFVSVVLFSENHGYRMKSYGPIPLIEIGDKSLLEKQVDAIQATFPSFEIILCSGFETVKTVNFIKEKFQGVNIRVVENQVHYNSNCCESARLCLNNTSNHRILFCGGGVLLQPEHLDLIDLKTSSIVYQKQQNDSNFEVGVIQNESYLEGLSIGVKDLYWTELLYLSNKNIIKTLYSILSNPEYKNRFIFEAINELSLKNKILTKYNTKNLMIKIDKIKTLKRITKQ